MLVSINKVVLKLFRNARWFHVFIEAHISGCHLCSPTKSNCLKLCTTKSISLHNFWDDSVHSLKFFCINSSRSIRKVFTIFSFYSRFTLSEHISYVQVIIDEHLVTFRILFSNTVRCTRKNLPKI